MILQSAKTFLATNSSIRVAHLIEIELAGSEGVFSYLTDYLSPITYGGVTYEAGKVVSVGSVKLTHGLRNYTLEINIAGEFQSEINNAVSRLST